MVTALTGRLNLKRSVPITFSVDWSIQVHYRRRGRRVAPRAAPIRGRVQQERTQGCVVRTVRQVPESQVCFLPGIVEKEPGRLAARRDYVLEVPPRRLESGPGVGGRTGRATALRTDRYRRSDQTKVNPATPMAAYAGITVAKSAMAELSQSGQSL